MRTKPEPTILPVKSATLNDKDRAALSAVGVIVIEHESPETLRLIKPSTEVSSSEMLRCAISALTSESGQSADAQRIAFTHALAKVIMSQL